MDDDLEPIQVELVEWICADVHPEWLSVEALESMGPIRVVSVGMIIDETSSHITMIGSATLNGGSSQLLHASRVIPIRAILSRQAFYPVQGGDDDDEGGGPSDPNNPPGRQEIIDRLRRN